MPIRNIIRVLFTVGILLLIPLAFTIRDGGVEGVGWNWTLSDFVVMGSLMTVVGLMIDLALRKITHPAYRILSVLLIVFAFLALWTELAVGAVSRLLTFLIG